MTCYSNRLNKKKWQLQGSVLTGSAFLGNQKKKKKKKKKKRCYKEVTVVERWLLVGVLLYLQKSLLCNSYSFWIYRNGEIMFTTETKHTISYKIACKQSED